MELPETLHAQLYLLAYDRERRCLRFDRDNTRYARWRFGYALFAAMLTDLYLTGYIEDKDGTAYTSDGARHDDPLLNEALRVVVGQEWAPAIARSGKKALRVVTADLEEAGWILSPPRRMFGVLPAANVEICDAYVPIGLAERVNDALRGILAGSQADPRSLALGLIAVQAQLAVVSHFIDDRRARDTLREMTHAAIEPILGLHQAIQVRLADIRGSSFSGG